MFKNPGILLSAVCIVSVLTCNAVNLSKPMTEQTPIEPAEAIPQTENVTAAETVPQTKTETAAAPKASAASNVSVVVSPDGASTTVGQWNAYEDTYEGQLQEIYDFLYVYTAEIEAAREKDGYNTAYDTSLALAKTVLDGKACLNEYPLSTYFVDGLVLFQGENAVQELFTQYPGQAAEENALIEFLRQYLYIETVIANFSTETLYENDALYEALFPDTGALTAEQVGEDVRLRFDGWDGGMVYVERADRLNQVWDCAVYPDFITVSDYTGIVSAAPVNAYGATGRTAQIEVAAGDGSGRILQICNCGISDTDALLAKINAPKIRTLEISYTEVNALDLSDFAKLDSLYLYADTALETLILPEKTSMTSAALCETALTDLSMFASYEKIGSLDIRDTKIANLDALAGKTVQILSFDADLTDYHGLSAIEGLRSLNIESEQALSSGLLEFVKDIPSLQLFSYNGEPVTLG